MTNSCYICTCTTIYGNYTITTNDASCHLVFVHNHQQLGLIQLRCTNGYSYLNYRCSTNTTITKYRTTAEKDIIMDIRIYCYINIFMLSRASTNSNNIITQIILKFMNHNVYSIVTCSGISNKLISTINKQ